MRRDLILIGVIGVVMATMLAVSSGFAGASPAPTITSDLPDYAPGSTVTLSGANWQGDAEVHIVVNDSVGQTWSHDATVTVAGDGTITDSFQLPSYFIANYSITKWF